MNTTADSPEAPARAPYARPALPGSDSQSVQGRVVIALFALRWAAGIVENLGVPALSQVAAVAMLGGLALVFLAQMRIASDAAVFVAGALAWVVSGSLSFAANPAADAQTTLALLLLLTLYALFANACMNGLATPRGAWRIYRMLALFLAVGAAISVLQLASGRGFVEAGKATIQRAFGSDVHPVSFAIQVVAALVGLEIARARTGQRPGLVHGALMATGALALYLTYARTAWVMALMVVGASFLLRGSWTRRLLLGSGALIAGMVAMATSDRFADLASLPVFLENFSPSDLVFDWRYIDNSVSWRIVNWTYGFNQALEQPVFGFGPGQSALSSYFNLEMHNIFLEALFEGGIFGLLTLLLTLAGLVRMHRRLPRATATDRYVRTLANSFGVALFFAVTFSTSFVDQLMSFLIYILMLAAAASRGVTRQPGTTSLTGW